MLFCNDVDLLHWEPAVFLDAAVTGQLLLSGLGNLAGTSFTATSGSFATNHVVEGNVLLVSGTIAGTYPIVAVNSATNLTISVLYDGLYPDSGPAVPTPTVTLSGLSYAVRTFGAQRKVASDLLLGAAGLGATAQASEATILNPNVLRRACVLGTLQMIYNAMAAAIPGADVATYLARSQTYARLYREAMRSAKVEVDLDGDGIVDEVRELSVLRFVRV
jgi:hypothetical protein